MPGFPGTAISLTPMEGGTKDGLAAVPLLNGLGLGLLT